MQKHPSVKVLAAGRWTEAQVHLTRAADGRQRHATVDQLIEQAWQAALARPNVKLFDGPMCRLESWAASEDKLDLAISPTSYRVFFGTNLQQAKLADKLSHDVMANPLGLSAALFTSDDYLILGRRNDRVAYYPSRIHPFAGALEPKDDASVFDGIRRELQEELSLKDADINSIHCLGLVEDQAIRQPEMVFKAHCRLTRAELENQLDAAEHAGVWSVAAEASVLNRAVESEELTPVARGTLLLSAASL